ncbi:hypothetical protein Daesc_010264 [Daldinia eschscholtzii]|uniref:Uncharacterized protein n=1 Tax=Daldinia eschscholtzii TaxID=292717 RepID=A0AAX6M7Y5_9PEZI
MCSSDGPDLDLDLGGKDTRAGDAASVWKRDDEHPITGFWALNLAKSGTSIAGRVDHNRGSTETVVENV